MADNDQNNDEYKFAELDSLDNDPMDDSDSGLNKSYTTRVEANPEKKDIKRNALIAVAVVVALMLAYKFIGPMFFSDKSESVTKTAIPPLTQVTPTQPVQTTTVTPVPVQQVQPVVTQSDPDLKQKVAAMEIAQQSIRSELSNVSDQVNTINNNINNLNNQIANLNQVIGTLSTQLAKQSEQVGVLMARTQPKQIRPVVRRATQPRLTYNIQAVIPGRAWLIASNGSTITVREGTKIAGYGVVKLIDSMQGRILTSSGQVIRFSQEDS